MKGKTATRREDGKMLSSLLILVMFGKEIFLLLKSVR